MQRTEPKVTRLSDYTPPAFFIDKVDLTFELDNTATKVTTHLEIRRNAEEKEFSKDLVLYGQKLKLDSLCLNGKKLPTEQFDLTDQTLTIKNVPEKCLLQIKTEINPQENTELLGLYKSKDNFATQCEAEGFRRITYFLDRPDVMATYTTTLIADEKAYPVLLSNGNLIGKGKLANGKHWFKWEDPFKKPSYLFALVAGNFELVEDNYLTQSGRNIKLQIFVEPGLGNRCGHAMRALKKAMKWDEDNYGRECDLDSYKIVGISDFNAGAMENKGLNIFNTKYILASPETATDNDYLEVEATIGHEYFHNWTGNRITCRDWFQLSLKEGLTTYREHAFIEDISSVAARISDVTNLRNRQFVEDAGPLAHPVQPQSYLEIDNFYTPTVYKKGAEIYRMLQITLGKELFRKGMDLYFERYDGQAVRIEDFIKVMEDASQKDLSQFLLWFHQAGTPELTIQDEYDIENHIYTLKIQQTCLPTPGQPDKKPLPIPVKMGLINEKGNIIPLQLVDEKSIDQEKVLLVTQANQEFRFKNITTRPIPSLLRGFSAPVKLNYNCRDEDLRLLSQYDTDLFNRWESGRKYINQSLLKLIVDYQNKKPLVIEKEFLNIFHSLLISDIDDLQIKAMMLTLPTENELANQMKIIDVEAILSVHSFVSTIIALKFQHFFEFMTQIECKEDPGKRSLKNLGLNYLMKLNDSELQKIAINQFNSSLASNMTDTLAALNALMSFDDKESQLALNEFYKHWCHDSRVLDFWFAAQANSPSNQTIHNVKKLLEHPDFDFKNPNKIYALLGSTGWSGNFSSFHVASGKGYEFLTDVILKIDAINPTCSATLVKPLTKWKLYAEERQKLMVQQLQRILSCKNISTNLYELVSKSIEDNKFDIALETKTSEVPRHKVSKVTSKAISKPQNNSYIRPVLYSLGGVTVTLAAFGIFRLVSNSSSNPEAEFKMPVSRK